MPRLPPILPAPPPPADLPESDLRRRVLREMRVWRISPFEVARRSGVLTKALTEWFDGHPSFRPSDQWLQSVLTAWRALIRERARLYLAEWDPDFRQQEQALAEAKKRRQAEIEARVAATREVA